MMLVTTAVFATAADYVLWLSPLQMAPLTTNLTVEPYQGNPAAVRVTTSASGDLQWVALGLPLPSDATIEGVELCYLLGNSTSYISQVRTTRMSTPDSRLTLYDDPTDLTSTSPTCYFSDTPSLPVEGTVSLELRLNFSSNAHWINIGAIGIHLSTPLSGVSDSSPDTPGSPEAEYPNPFRPPTAISYTLPSDGFAEVEIHDVAGRLLCTLVSGEQPAGDHVIHWDGRDFQGHAAAAGTYFYRVRVGDRVGSRSMILSK